MSDVVTWGRSAGAYARVIRVQDTAANRAYLQSVGAQDGTPSAIVKMGADVALLSGEGLRTASRVATNNGNVINPGAMVAVDGIAAQVLSTDDGLSEIDASNVVVAVVDTGVDISHPALRGRLVQGYNSVDGTTNVQDNNGHGTHVAGTIVGAAGLDPQAEGVAQGTLVMPIRACDNNGRFTDQSISDGIIYAVEHGARVVNLSLEDHSDLPRTALAIDYAQKMGAVVVVAAGNEGAGEVDSPAKYAGAIAVGSSTWGNRSSFSNGGPRLDVTAPGENITAPVPGGYGTKSGTSMSAPYVAATAALILARHPEWTPAQVQAQLEWTATDYGTAGKDNAFGYGEVNVQEAVFGGAAPSRRQVRATVPQAAPVGTGGLASRFMSWFQSLFGGGTPSYAGYRY